MRHLPLFPFLLLCAIAAQAADKQKFDSLPEPPPPAQNYQAPAAPAPTTAPTDEAIPEPEVVITTKGEDRHEEYRIGGRLYMIKIIPKIGKPYYLIDQTGEGEFARSDFAPSVRPPMWVIKRF